ncbi:hypothetical protein DAEQUDRAFT_777180 [Daedalea quercina L-15889]|uniref:Uncharacterized protein n=1 Tax=Daedalea quercina L-15889 TaxID=1314783 RepID=A0A165KX84_9APHY|nr:hypothetical protein DAEQUDRAFT_777180 [Daedalea quercina L-15889]
MRATGTQDIQSAVQLALANNYVLVAAFARPLQIFAFSATKISSIWTVSMITVSEVDFHLTLHWALLVTIASQVALAVFDAVIAGEANVAAIMLQQCVANFGVILVITALRVYAINDRDWRLPVIVLLLSLIRTAYDLFGTATKTAMSLPAPLGCAVESNSSMNTPAVADVIVLIVTWRRTYHTIRLTYQRKEGPRLSFLLWRDGTIYFGSLLVISIVDVVVYTAESFQGFQYLRLAFSTIILSRFFLNLRAASQSMVNSTASRSTLTPTLLSSFVHFPRGIDTFGGSLAFFDDADDMHHTEDSDEDLNRIAEEVASGGVTEGENG